jgi:putative transposase
MRKSKLSEPKIFEMLKGGEVGIPTEELCRKYEVSRCTYYKLKSKYSGLQLSDLKRLKELEEENRRLKHMYAELSLDHQVLKDVLTKKFPGQFDVK